MTPFLAVTGLGKVYRDRHGERAAVADATFELLPGGCLAIVGESGSGKTTVARMLMGLVTPTAGTVTINGADRTRPPRSTRERRARAADLQMVFQDPYASLDRRQSAGACLEEVLVLRGMGRTARRDRIAELAGLVGLDPVHLSARPRQMSGGQRQRLAIARALAAEPAGLVMDEPVSALDVSIQAQVLNVVADVRERTGLALLFITHDLAVVRQVADDIVVMRAGRIVERGSVGAVLDDPRTEYTRDLLDSVPRPGWRPRRRSG